MKMHVLIAIALLAVSPLESDAAFADRARFDVVTQQGIVYLSLSDVAEKDRDELANVVSFVVPSLSNRPNLSQQLPQRVLGTPLMRLDLEELGWQNHYQQSVRDHYPYRPDVIQQTQSFPLVVSALWFIACATDPNETKDMYYQLLYSGKPPKTTKEFHAFWKVQARPRTSSGLSRGNPAWLCRSTGLSRITLPAFAHIRGARSTARPFQATATLWRI